MVHSTWDRELVRLVTLRDITETALMRERLKEEAQTDYLTGLLNRRGFVVHAQERVLLADRLDKSLVCLFLDLDGFKRVNDTLGHDEGDAALRDAAQALRETFRASDLLGRIGGDEFAVLLMVDHPDHLDYLRLRLQGVVDAHNSHTTRPYRMSLSTGHAVRSPGQGLTLEELMDQADQRMYAEKAAKRTQDTR